MRVSGRVRRFLANLIIAYCLYIMAFLSLPASPFRENVLSLVPRYNTFFGYTQAWDLFAPEPVKMNISVYARLTAADGKTWTWRIPGADELGFLGGIRHEQFHKYVDQIRGDEHWRYWPEFARYVSLDIARKNGLRIGAGDAYRIDLVRTWAAIPDPQPGDYQPIPEHYDQPDEYRFYSTKVVL